MIIHSCHFPWWRIIISWAGSTFSLRCSWHLLTGMRRGEWGSLLVNTLEHITYVHTVHTKPFLVSFLISLNRNSMNKKWYLSYFNTCAGSNLLLMAQSISLYASQWKVIIEARSSHSSHISSVFLIFSWSYLSELDAANVNNGWNARQGRCTTLEVST